MSEKLTDSRRAALRDRGIFPRSVDFNVLLAVIGALIGFKMLALDPLKHYELTEIMVASLLIPFCAALGSVLATLIQSKFLFHFAFSKERKETSLTDTFYFLVKFIVSIVVGAILFRNLLSSAANGTLSAFPFLNGSISLVVVIFIVFGLIGLLVSRFTFIERYQMSKAEVEADSREGEMRPELKAAIDSSFSDEDKQ